MTSGLRIAVIGFLVPGIAFGIGGLPTEPFPALNAQTLSGKKIAVPRDLKGISVLVVGFTKQSRTKTSDWGVKLRADSQVSGAASIYEVVALENVPGFVRSTVIKQLKTGIPKARHDRLLVVTESVLKWKDVLRAADEDDAYVAVVGPNGELIWTARGSVTVGGLHQLKEAMGLKK